MGNETLQVWPYIMATSCSAHVLWDEQYIFTPATTDTCNKDSNVKTEQTYHI